MERNTIRIVNVEVFKGTLLCTYCIQRVVVGKEKCNRCDICGTVKVYV
jgi:hypothetical protein